MQSKSFALKTSEWKAENSKDQAPSSTKRRKAQKETTSLYDLRDPSKTERLCRLLRLLGRLLYVKGQSQLT